MRYRVVFTAVLVAATLPVAAQIPTVVYQGSTVAANDVILRLRSGDAPTLARIAARIPGARIVPIGTSLGLHVLTSSAHTVATLMTTLKPDSDILYVHPNLVIRVVAIPTDPLFPQLWGIQKIAAPQAWDISTGSGTLAVGVIDTGIDYTHPDLAANMWNAPAAFTVNLGGQNVTCPAGSHGFNAIAMNCDPMDDNSHGTHVSGTIGAAGNNSVGVAGINWHASLVGIKFMDSTGSGKLSDALKGMEFAIQAKAAFGSTLNLRVLSASWGGTDFAQSLLDELNNVGSHEMLFVAAAGNAGSNNDSAAFYPANYSAPNVISVAATDSSDGLASFSDYGFASVHLGAPGVGVLSTVLNAGYASYSGTSMATPHVSGAALLTLAACPALNTTQLKGTLLSTVDPAPALAGRTITGGRLNVRNAIQSCANVPVPPNPICVSTVAGDHWKGEYFNNAALSGSPVMVRDDGMDTLNLNWGYQGSPNNSCGVPGTLFSVRWTRLATFSAGVYRFSTSSDDGMRLYIDGQKTLDRWFDQPASPQTVNVTLAGGTHTLVVEYYQALGNASAGVGWQQLSGAGCLSTVAGDHWKGEYFSNTALSGSPVMVRDDGTDVVNFNWGYQGSPSTACNVPGTLFSARWTRLVAFTAGTYRFTTSSDDGMRLYIDGQKIQDRWYDQEANAQTVDVTLTGGTHTVMVEYYQDLGGASAAVSWQQLSGAGCIATVAADRWKGEYFNNIALAGTAVMVRDDGAAGLSFDWGNQGSPNASCNVPGVLFSARWTRLAAFTAGTYRFATSADDGMRLYIDGQLIQDRWVYQTASLQTVDITLSGGNHTLVVEYFQGGGQDSASVSWQPL